MPPTSTTTTSGAGHLGEDLRAARQEAGLTRADLARLVGCSLASLGNLEAGAIPRRSAVLERVLAVLSPKTSGARVTTPSPTKTAKTVATHASG